MKPVKCWLCGDVTKKTFFFKISQHMVMMQNKNKKCIFKKNIDIKNRKLQLYDYLYNFEIKFVETIIKNKC